MIHLIVQYYQVNYTNIDDKLIQQRQDEINRCFLSNLSNPNIDKLHFLYEKIEDVNYMQFSLGISKKHPKLVLYNLGKRMNYADIFNYPNNYPQKTNDIWIYLHGDMQLISGFEKLRTINMDSNKIYALTAHNPKKCNKQILCNCTRQYITPKGLYGPTFDGFIFKSPIKQSVIDTCNHIVHCLGAENRTIAILKNNNYNVVCPNHLLMCHHIHNVQIFAGEHSMWINLKGEYKPKEFYSNIHKEQKNKKYQEKIVGGGIPFYLGCVKFVDKL